MRGAIEHVTIDQGTFTPSYRVIGDVAPKGICGSAIIDTVAEMFKVGVLDFAGKIVEGKPRVRHGATGLEYVIVPADQSQVGRDIVITQSDMAYIMDSKAAACGAIGVLMKKYKLSIDDVAHVYLAGAFGTYTNPKKLMEFGVLPAFPNAHFHSIGNGSLSGAFATLVSMENREAAQRIADKMVYIDLLVDVDFIEEYTAALYIPGKKRLFSGAIGFSLKRLMRDRGIYSFIFV
jgi:uncharacterized 2Fe-2S/4Fe-4S cluster protein (DUF4445 family)